MHRGFEQYKKKTNLSSVRIRRYEADSGMDTKLGANCGFDYDDWGDEMREAGRDE